MALNIDSRLICSRCKSCKCYDECYADLDVNVCDFQEDCERCTVDDLCFMPEDDV